MKDNTENERKSKKITSARARDIALLGITLALIIILQLFAELFQKLGMPISLALGLIPVLVISQYSGIKLGSVCGLFYGLVSLVMAVVGAAAIPMYAVAINPLVSVLPRILVGVVSALVFGAINKAFSKRCPNPTSGAQKKHTVIASAAATALGVITNTVLFLSMFYAFAHGKDYGGLIIDFKWLLSSVVALNTVIELAVFTFAVPMIVLALKSARFSKNAAKDSM
jgi:uncharacterized membrane protein